MSIEVNSAAIRPVEGEAGSSDRPARLNFHDPREREAHIGAFLTWLPKILHDAPGIDWNRLPSQVMGYLIHTVSDGPDAIPITLAVGCAMDGMKQKVLYTICSKVTTLLKLLRSKHDMRDYDQLSKRDIWECFVAGRELSAGEAGALKEYESLTSVYLGTYWEGLSERQQLLWKPFILPRMPRGFIDKHGIRRAAMDSAERRRKDQSDVLVPLFPLLVEIAQLRKQAAERMIKKFRQLRACALSGEIELPHRFQYPERLLSVSEDTTTIAETRLIEREVTLSFTLWNRTRWVEEHPERYSSTTFKYLKRKVRAYAPENDSYFLHYHGQTSDLLWFGDILADGLLNGKMAKGYETYRPGLLTPAQSDASWFMHACLPGEVLFEPESLYRGILYGAALASLSLTNGSRASELVQVSATRFETIVVDELKNQQPTGRQIGIVVQNLLPKGYTQESERQFFLVSEMASRLLKEIHDLLLAAHGGTIPVVHPNPANHKSEDLYPEPYLFQWATSDEGRLGQLQGKDVGALLRFLFHGLTLTTRTGEPIRVAAHLLRHVLATHARQVQQVPAEAVAYLLHHRVALPDGPRALSIPQATEYYGRKTVPQLMAMLFDAQSQLSAHPHLSYLQAPTPQTLEQLDEKLRRNLEQWGLIGATALGHCSAGVCIRPDNRALCLNCQFLVPHYRNLHNARTWRRLYALQAKMHDEQGHHIDAQQARKMMQYLDDNIAIMQIQIRTRQDGGYLPFADTLQQTTDEDGDE